MTEIGGFQNLLKKQHITKLFQLFIIILTEKIVTFVNLIW